MSYHCTADCISPEGSAKLSHCRQCHLTFATVESFDLHRYDPDLAEDQDNTCWEPASIGLDSDAKGVYGTEEELAERLRVANLLQKAREARGNH